MIPSHRLTRFAAYALAPCLLLSLTACMKTRAQLKGDQDQSGDVASEGAVQSKPANFEMDEIKNEVTRISGRVEELDHNQRGQPNGGELKEYIAKLDGRISELEKNQILVMSEVKALKDKQSSVEETARAVSTPPSDLLTKGNQLLNEKKCEEAGEAFKALLNRPGVKSKDASDAHFGLGESEYCRKDYKKAILEFSAVRKTFAKSTKIPSSLYRIALAFNHLNMQEEANGFLKELVEKYPNTPEAKKARAKVKE